MTAQTLAPATAALRYMASGSDTTDLVAWLADASHGVLALDTETTGLDTRVAGFRVRQIAFGASDGTAYVLDAGDTEMCRAALAGAVRSGRKIWAHNATYDSMAIWHGLGLRVRNLRCSLVLTRTLDPGLIGTPGGSLKVLRPATQRALERLAAHWSAVSGVRVEAAGEHTWLADAVAGLPPSDPILIAYVATDAVEAARLVDYWSSVSNAETRHVALRETVVEDLWRWPADRGYLVDMDRLKVELGTLERVRREVVDRWGVDLTSNSNTTREWIRTRGIRIANRDGSPTLSHKAYDTAYVPERSADDWAAFKAAREVAQTANKLNELAALAVDGRVHPSIRGIGAHTGRMSIGKPALQNLPASLRSLLMAEPGMVLVGCDLDRVEPRVVAALSEDPDLVAAVQADVYVELAVAIWGEGARSDAQARKIAKTAFLASFYGQGASSLAANLGVDEGEARDVLTRIGRAYPVMSAWADGLRSAARAGRPLSTADGRPLPQTQTKPYLAVNWVVQGSAADLFKRITIDVAERLGRDSLWLPVHDELIVQVPLGDEARALEVLGSAMTTDLLGVPISGTPAVIGDRWGKL